MIIPPRFNGPPGSANGGIACGLLAKASGYAVAEVTLRRPPPLGVELVVRDGSLLHGDDLVATVAPGEVTIQPPAAVGLPAALAAPSVLGQEAHPFPTCFVCGTARDDGLGLLPGRVSGDLVAAVWTPDEAPEVGADVMVWAALDCPGGWSVDLPGRPMVLGRMACVVDGLPVPGRPHLLQGWVLGTEGRKAFTGSALYDESGTVLAVAQSTWITLPA